MTVANITQQNFVGGELSPSMRGRYDLPIYASGCEKMLNFIAEATGPARFRNGSQYDINTRRNRVAGLLPFQFNDTQAYELEFTEGYIRFHLEDGILVESPVPVTAITQANPAVVTAPGHGYADGDEVLISEVVGMVQLDNRSLIVKNATTDTFTLTDQDGVDIDSTLYDAYIIGGVAERIYEIQSPYQEEDLFSLKWGQNADTQVIVGLNYEPRKLVRSGLTNWSLSLFTRIADPFTDKKTITMITQAIPAVVTAAAHGYVANDQVILENVAGMTQVNGRVFKVANITANTFELQELDGTPVNSLVYGTYASGGYASDRKLLPGTVAYYQGRIIYAHSETFPNSFWGSKALDASGNPQYDDMTTGTNAADGFKFTLSPTPTGKVDIIEDLVPTPSFLGLMTFQGISKADGGANGEAITPSNIRVVPAVAEGCSPTVRPYMLGTNVVFFHRTGLIMYSLEFNIFYNAYDAVDKNLDKDHITVTGVKQMVYTVGRPSAFWMCRNDGILLGDTAVIKENINGWHRHKIGGVDSKVLSVGSAPRSNKFDRLWLVVERTIQEKTRRYVEYVNDPALIPEKDDYWSGDVNENIDVPRWRRAMFEAQKQYIHLDSTLTYDGRFAPQYYSVEEVCE